MFRLGQRLHALRLERKVPLEEMIWGIEFSGKGHLLEIESGRSVPSLSMLVKIARFLKMDLMDLINSPERSLRHRLLELTRHLSQEAIARLVEFAERLRNEETPPQ